MQNPYEAIATGTPSGAQQPGVTQSNPYEAIATGKPAPAPSSPYIPSHDQTLTDPLSNAGAAPTQKLRKLPKFSDWQYHDRYADPVGTDCSSFVQAIAKQQGHDIPRTAIQQYQKLPKVLGPAVSGYDPTTGKQAGGLGPKAADISKLQPGDIVFFDNLARTPENTKGKKAGDGYVNHVAYYIGNGQVVQDNGHGVLRKAPLGWMTTAYRFMGAARPGMKTGPFAGATASATVNGPAQRIMAGNAPGTDYLKLGPALGLPKFQADPDPRGDSSLMFENYKSRVEYLLQHPGIQFKQGDMADLGRAIKENEDNKQSGLFNLGEVGQGLRNISTTVLGQDVFSGTGIDTAADTAQRQAGEALDNPASTVVQIGAFEGGGKLLGIVGKAAFNRLEPYLAKGIASLKGTDLTAVTSEVRTQLEKGVAPEDLKEALGPGSQKVITQAQRTMGKSKGEMAGLLAKERQGPTPLRDPLQDEAGFKGLSDVPVKPLTQQERLRIPAQSLPETAEIPKQPTPRFKWNDKTNLFEDRPAPEPRETPEPTTKPPSPTATRASEPRPPVRTDLPEGALQTPKREDIAALREQMGWDEYTPGKRTWDEAAQEAYSKGYIARASSIAAQVLAKPRALSDSETFGLSAALKGHVDQMEKFKAARDGPNWDIHYDLANQLADAIDRSGTEKARGLAAQKMVLRNSYDQFSVERRILKGRPDATPDQIAQVEKTRGELETSRGELETLENQRAQAQAEQARTGATQAFAAATPQPASAKRWFSEEAYAAAMARMKAIANPEGEQSAFGGPLSDQMLKDLVTIGGYHLENILTKGGAKVADLIDKMKSEAPGLPEDHYWMAADHLLSDRSRTLNAGRAFGEDILTEGKNAIQSADVAKLRTELDGLRKEFGRAKNAKDSGLLTKLKNQVDQLEGMSKKPMDLDAYKQLRESIMKTSRELNAGRGMGKNVLRQGSAGIEDPEVAAARERVDQLKLKIDAQIKDLSMPLAAKVFNSVENFPRAVAIGGGIHGPALMFTHAAKNLFRPSTSLMWLENTVKAWRVWAGDDAIYNEAMQRLTGDPLPGALSHETKVQLGLAVDRHYVEDFTLASKIIQKVGGPIGKGARAADFLKVLRNQMYDHFWLNASPETRAAEGFDKRLASWVNEATGAHSLGHGWGATLVDHASFAARLEASNWAATAIGPFKMIGEIASKDPASRAMGLMRLRQGGALVATYETLLGMNWAINKFRGIPDEKNVNFFDFHRGDFQAFSNGETTWSPMSRQTGILKLIENVGEATYHQATGTLAANQPGAIQELLQYGRGKLNPIYSIASDAVMRKDFMGRPMPWASEKEKDAAKFKGKDAYSWHEYLIDHGPIPFADGARAFYDGMRKGGVAAHTAEDFAARLFLGLAGTRTGKVSVSHKVNVYGLPESKDDVRDPYLADISKLRKPYETKRLTLVNENGDAVRQETHAEFTKRKTLLGQALRDQMKDEMSPEEWKKLSSADKLSTFKKVAAWAFSAAQDKIKLPKGLHYAKGGGEGDEDPDES